MQSLPEIDALEDFDAVVSKLSVFFVSAIEAPCDWEGLRREVYSSKLRFLVNHLIEDVEHPAILCALLALKWHFSALESEDDRGINETRALSCELVAWRFTTHLTHRESIRSLCYELPSLPKTRQGSHSLSPRQGADVDLEEANVERAPLLGDPSVGAMDTFLYDETPAASEYAQESDFALLFANLNALEIAAVANAKKFLSQKSILRIVDGIWNGDIVFWETMDATSTKQAQVYRKSQSDPYCRLRVPLYLKMFEVLFFAAFLAFYYTVLVRKHSGQVTFPEVMMYIWLAAFTYNELGEFWDAGSTFYATDFWSLWDVAIIIVGCAFFVIRIIGLTNDNRYATDLAFDVLSVEALFLVPRIFSLLSLLPYFGMLLPALKEMTKDSVKFLGLVAILYLGFSTALAFLARGTYTFAQMNWILIKVFFGSSYLGFDISEKISPILGPPLMFIFVFLTNILLVTSLISLLSNTLSKVMQHARDEYHFVYAVYVLEASTSNRLTYFLPPLNLLALLLRPLRLILPAASVRKARITLLKATHWPFVALIFAYESGRAYLEDRRRSGFSNDPRRLKHTEIPASLRRSLSRRALVIPRPRSLAEQPQSQGAARSPLAMPGMQETGTPASRPETHPAAQMADVVAQLQEQIDALTALVASQRQHMKTQ